MPMRGLGSQKKKKKANRISAIKICLEDINPPLQFYSLRYFYLCFSISAFKTYQRFMQQLRIEMLIVVEHYLTQDILSSFLLLAQKVTFSKL